MAKDLGNIEIAKRAWEDTRTEIQKWKRLEKSAREYYQYLLES